LTLLSVIIPVYNEEKFILKILEKIDQVEIDKEIIIIDDRSTDNSLKLIKKFIFKKSKVEIISNEKNLGRSQSLLKGINIAKGEIIIPQDADLEYDPKDYLKIVEPIQKNKYNVVFGSRSMGEDGYTVDAFYATFGLKFLNLIQNFLYGTNYTDSCTCYIAMKKEIWKSIDLSKTTNFTLNATVTSYLAKKKIKVLEVPIRYHPRRWEDGKKVRIFRDGREHIFTLIKERFSK
tara:strand:+ start:315 stop:1013 length:699 start_codon:yes stop_codon:yes gene_type:complete